MKNKSKMVKYFDSITKTDIDWFWYPYIPLGKVTLIQGDPGCGKSSLIIKLAALASTGGVMPDGKCFKSGINVIYQCIEDGIADTIKPRFVANSANISKISYIADNDEIFSEIDKKRIIDSINETGARLVIFDPIQSFLCKTGFAYTVAGSRDFMNTLISIADETKSAIVIIGHLNKNENSKALYRGLGSIDIAASVRSVLQVERLKSDSNIRLIKHIKSSLAPEGDLFGFEISSEGKVDFIGSIDMEKEVDSIVDQSKTSFDTKMNTSEKFLIKELSKGDRRYNDILNMIQKKNISVRTLNNAKKSLGIISIKKKDGWYWHYSVDIGSDANE